MLRIKSDNVVAFIGKWLDIKPGDRLTDELGVILPTGEVAKSVILTLADDFSDDLSKRIWPQIVDYLESNPHDVKVTIVETR